MATSAASKIIVYAMPGSQYTAKVLAALDARKIEHYVSFVPLDPAKRNLPSGGALVPELQYGSEVVPDSEAILHWLDKNFKTEYFPSKEASDISLRASDGVLSGAVLYYNWVDEEGYQRSMHQSLLKAVPWYIFLFRDSIVDRFAASARNSFRVKAAKGLGMEELEEEPVVHSKLVEELTYFQSQLQDNADYFLGMKQSTAADFSVYAQLERLVGDMGDGQVAASMPQLKSLDSLDRLWKWHEHMRNQYPIQFKGKRLQE